MLLQPQTIKILVADRHELIRIGLRAALENYQPLACQIIAEADSFDKTLQLTSQYKPDILLLDLILNDGDCLKQIPKLLTLCPQLKILLFTSNNEVDTHLCALRMGVVGIVAKYQSANFLLKSIHAVSAGQLWFERNITQLALQAQSTVAPKAVSIITNLTPRERKISCMSSKGLCAKKIAAALSLSEKTVRNQLTVIYQKLNVRSQIELCLQFNHLDFCTSSEDFDCSQDKCPNDRG